MGNACHKGSNRSKSADIASSSQNSMHVSIKEPTTPTFSQKSTMRQNTYSRMQTNESENMQSTSKFVNASKKIMKANQFIAKSKFLQSSGQKRFMTNSQKQSHCKKQVFEALRFIGEYAGQVTFVKCNPSLLQNELSTNCIVTDWNINKPTPENEKLNENVLNVESGYAEALKLLTDGDNISILEKEKQIRRSTTAQSQSQISDTSKSVQLRKQKLDEHLPRTETIMNYQPNSNQQHVNQNQVEEREDEQNMSDNQSLAAQKVSKVKPKTQGVPKFAQNTVIVESQNQQPPMGQQQVTDQNVDDHLEEAQQIKSDRSTHTTQSPPFGKNKGRSLTPSVLSKSPNMTLTEHSLSPEHGNESSFYKKLLRDKKLKSLNILPLNSESVHAQLQSYSKSFLKETPKNDAQEQHSNNSLNSKSLKTLSQSSKKEILSYISMYTPSRPTVSIEAQPLSGSPSRFENFSTNKKKKEDENQSGQKYRTMYTDTNEIKVPIKEASFQRPQRSPERDFRDIKPILPKRYAKHNQEIPIKHASLRKHHRHGSRFSKSPESTIEKHYQDERVEYKTYWKIAQRPRITKRNPFGDTIISTERGYAEANAKNLLLSERLDELRQEANEEHASYGQKHQYFSYRNYMFMNGLSPNRSSKNKENPKNQSLSPQKKQLSNSSQQALELADSTDRDFSYVDTRKILSKIQTPQSALDQMLMPESFKKKKTSDSSTPGTSPRRPDASTREDTAQRSQKSNTINHLEAQLDLSKYVQKRGIGGERGREVNNKKAQTFDPRLKSRSPSPIYKPTNQEDLEHTITENDSQIYEKFDMSKLGPVRLLIEETISSTKPKTAASESQTSSSIPKKLQFQVQPHKKEEISQQQVQLVDDDHSYEQILPETDNEDSLSPQKNLTKIQGVTSSNTEKARNVETVIDSGPTTNYVDNQYLLKKKRVTEKPTKGANIKKEESAYSQKWGYMPNQESKNQHRVPATQHQTEFIVYSDRSPQKTKSQAQKKTQKQSSELQVIPQQPEEHQSSSLEASSSKFQPVLPEQSSSFQPILGNTISTQRGSGGNLGGAAAASQQSSMRILPVNQSDAQMVSGEQSPPPVYRTHNYSSDSHHQHNSSNHHHHHQNHPNEISVISNGSKGNSGSSEVLTTRFKNNSKFLDKIVNLKSQVYNKVIESDETEQSRFDNDDESQIQDVIGDIDNLNQRMKGNSKYYNKRLTGQFARAQGEE